eukprot:362504-Chlamydomonas_euryale.AAC.19
MGDVATQHVSCCLATPWSDAICTTRRRRATSQNFFPPHQHASMMAGDMIPYTQNVMRPHSVRPCPGYKAPVRARAPAATVFAPSRC